MLFLQWTWFTYLCHLISNTAISLCTFQGIRHSFPLMITLWHLHMTKLNKGLGPRLLESNKTIWQESSCLCIHALLHPESTQEPAGEGRERDLGQIKWKGLLINFSHCTKMKTAHQLSLDHERNYYYFSQLLRRWEEWQYRIVNSHLLKFTSTSGACS